jgi:hypothetical protein
MLDCATLTPFRRELLSLISPERERLAPEPTTAFVWPTEKCSIGCAHCNFGSLPLRAGMTSDVQLDPQLLVQWLVDAGVRTAVLCGGGEPLDEPDFCNEVIRLCGINDMSFAIYTSGSSLRAPSSPAEDIRRWRQLRGTAASASFWIRLSLDAFHADRLGTSVVADWIRKVEELAPEWRVSVRALRILGDNSLAELAGQLGAVVRERGTSSARLDLQSGRSIPVERMAYIVDGRASIELLSRRGLELPATDQAILSSWQSMLGRGRQIGRVISRPLTVGRHRVDLEIHADTAVHVLESQPFDSRLSLKTYNWIEMRDFYYRDPIVHAVSVKGLPLIADYLRQAIHKKIAPKGTVPFSVERINDPDVLDWLTASVTVHLADLFAYPEQALKMAQRRLYRSIMLP